METCIRLLVGLLVIAAGCLFAVAFACVGIYLFHHETARWAFLLLLAGAVAYTIGDIVLD